MQSIATPPQSRVVIRAGTVDLPDDLRTRATERANRLVMNNAQVRQIALTLDQDGGNAAASVVAKGEIMFDGPALLTSVTAATAAQALDYLFDKLESQLRRQRAPRPGWVSRRPPPARAAVASATAGTATAPLAGRTARPTLKP